MMDTGRTTNEYMGDDPAGIETPGVDLISVVVPCYNEAENVSPLVTGVTCVLEKMGIPFEIVLVDDGSRDDTWAAIRVAAKMNAHVVGLRLSRNFSHQSALIAGLRRARGTAIISMDADLQHPPETLPALISAWRQGFSVVSTRRNDTETATFFKRTTSRLFYRVFSFLAGIAVEPGTSDFRLLDRRTLDLLLNFAEADKFLRGSIEWMGFRSAVVDYDAAKRHSGRSKYTLGRMVRFASVAITSFSTQPLRIGIWLGLAVSIMAFAELLYVIAMALTGQTVPGWASTLGVISFLFGVLFVVIGVMGLYIARIYALLQNRPSFIVVDTVEAAPGPARVRAMAAARPGSSREN
ncbi:MAG: glycosyltransferase family 2 protein [Alphaproteobacteria bacterium]